MNDLRMAIRPTRAARLASACRNVTVIGLAVLAAACPGNNPTTPTPPSTAPTISNVTPANGTTLGGTEVVVTGTNLASTSTVTFGGVAATNVRVGGATSLVATTGAHAAGLVDVAVSAGGQTGMLVAGFTYATPPGPTVAEISPKSGSTAGGTAVTITGTNFAPGATVAIGGVAATAVEVVSATTIRAVTGARVAGPSDVVVVVGSQTATLPGAFSYVAPAQNPLPVIAGINVQGTRANEPANFADLGEDVVVTAAVFDGETAPDALIYEWTADAGTFTGTGRSVRWRAPAAAATPASLKITLKVSETISGVAGMGEAPQALQSVTAFTTVRVHDSTKEVGTLSVDFLVEFSNSSLPAEFVVRNFWDGCSGKAAELQDVTDHRKNFLVTGYKIGTPSSVAVHFSGVCALNEPGDGCAVVPCEWNDIYKPLNEAGTATGTCYLSTVYRESKWWLCGSRWQGTSTHPPRIGVTFLR